MCDQKWMIYKYIRSQFEAHSMGRVYRLVRFSYSNYLHRFAWFGTKALD